MATGSGLGGLIPLVMTVAGIIGMIRARARRRRGPQEPDPVEEKRMAATRESQRRMAAYLAQNRASSYEASVEQDEQENRT